MKRWITVREAAKMAGVPVWTMRRRLKEMDQKTGGRLLQRNGKSGWLRVDSVELGDLLIVEREQRRGRSIREEVDELRERQDEQSDEITKLKDRTWGMSRRLSKHSREIEKTNEKVSRVERATKHLQLSMTELLGVDSAAS